MNYKKYNRSCLLDVFKGILIIFVVITHFNFQYPSDYLKFGFPFYIDMAVPCFITLTAFLFSLSLERNKINITQYYNLSYIIPKLLRFLIPYILIIIVQYFLIYGYNLSISKFVDILFMGGGRPWCVLHNCIDTIYFYFSIVLLSC